MENRIWIELSIFILFAFLVTCFEIFNFDCSLCEYRHFFDETGASGDF